MLNIAHWSKKEELVRQFVDKSMKKFKTENLSVQCGTDS